MIIRYIIGYIQVASHKKKKFFFIKAIIILSLLVSEKIVINLSYKN